MPEVGLGEYTPFYKDGDLEVGDQVMIMTEFKQEGKFNAWQGEVQKSDESKLKITLNKTSLYACGLEWGGNSANWVGKVVKFSREDVASEKYGTKKNCRIFRPVK